MNSIAGLLVWLWIGAASSAVSALACLIVAAAAVSFLRHRADLAPVARRLGFLLVAFLVVVALTHLTQAFAPWPLAGRAEVAVVLVRAVTAVVSLGAVLLVWPQLPRLLEPALAARPGALERGARPGERLARDDDRLADPRARARRTSASRPRSRARNITVFTQDRACASPGSTIRGRASPPDGRRHRSAAVGGGGRDGAGGDRDR